MSRTPQDYAIEHAGYLATAATNLLDVLGREDAARITHDDNPCLDTSRPLAMAEEWRGEAATALRSAIYEFEKRRDRAISAGVTAAHPHTSSQQPPMKGNN